MIPRALRRSPAWSRWLGARVRSIELLFVLVAVVVGMGAGLLTVLQGTLARALQHLLYRLPDDLRLSGAPALDGWQLLVLPLGGAVLVAFNRIVGARRRSLVDAVEANALHGGQLSVRDSAIVSGQTILSNGFGASVGLEAAYAQLGGLIASASGRWLALRRIDVRTLVGAGAGAAIAAAFGAPLAGAFYAFEVVIGAYTPAAIAPVVAAALAGSQVAQRLGTAPYIVAVERGPAIHSFGYLVYGVLGVLCALVGIAIMRSVGVVEAQTRARLPAWSRPVIGGALLAALAAVSPQVLSAGHSALHLDITAAVPLAFVATILLTKALASVVSLGFGFRGGLFFASLFLGTLVGHLYAGALGWVAGESILNPGNAAMVGMAALAVAVIGAPFTMTMLVLEATGNFSLTGAVLAASLVSSTIVRQFFGYSFSTWRLHLRGETIRSARDVGWVKALTAGRMMRRQPNMVAGSTGVAEFRRRFPLGSTKRVIVLDDGDRYAGIVDPVAAHDGAVDDGMPVLALAQGLGEMLRPEMDIRAVMARFDAAQREELAVVDEDGRVLGLLTEAHVRRRYGEELEKSQRELFGEV
ncbi:chloride channel protein [Sphingomonas sp. BK580]|uniref:chloride channel protein n=1 Tax=Sphingomonas sp. BK580 TaxID=2586972 RepID=UPI00160821A4|nr:chloride channel protein [Sphingomonas sp. BK580]MBB3695524.1 CIC family chloride channel protein [Sphingomonas sp. BK580]